MDAPKTHLYTHITEKRFYTGFENSLKTVVQYKRRFNTL